MEESKIISEPCHTVYIESTKHSYGIFCFNSSGDLFLNSDWGMHGYAWRHYGQNGFIEFLKGLNAEYVVGKFEYNFISTGKKKLNANWRKNLEGLTGEFLDFIRKNF